MTTPEKRNLRYRSGDRISCNAKDTLGRLRKLGFSSDALQLRRTGTFFRRLRMNSTEPVQRKRSQSRRRKQTCAQSYRNKLFGNLKRSFNLRQVRSDQKQTEPESPVKSPRGSGFFQLKTRIDQIKRECRKFAKSRGKYASRVRAHPDSKWGSERKAKDHSKLRVFKYKNATLVSDPRSGKSVSLYKTGEVFFGSVNQSNEAHGPGIFFFPFCGFVFGNFENNKIHGQGIFKEPNSSFGIGSFEQGIMGDFQIHFDLRQSPVDPKPTGVESKALCPVELSLTPDQASQKESEAFTKTENEEPGTEFKFRVKQYVEGVLEDVFSCREGEWANAKTKTIPKSSARYFWRT